MYIDSDYHKHNIINRPCRVTFNTQAIVTFSRYYMSYDFVSQRLLFQQLKMIVSSIWLSMYRFLFLLSRSEINQKQLS